ncbi:MAG: hypothetical protein ACRDP3_23870, partial [Streptomyces sp.]
APGTAQMSRVGPERAELPQQSVPAPAGAPGPYAPPGPPGPPGSAGSAGSAGTLPPLARRQPVQRARTQEAPASEPERVRPPRASAVADGERPELPKRRRQEHLAPELRDAPPAPRHDDSGSAGWDETEQGHDPGLLAAFRRGTSLAEDSDGNDATRPAR